MYNWWIKCKLFKVYSVVSDMSIHSEVILLILINITITTHIYFPLGKNM